MVTATDTRVIDAEFAAYGPIGFDLGLFVGNLLMAYFSQPGHESNTGERFEHGRVDSCAGRRILARIRREICRAVVSNTSR